MGDISKNFNRREFACQCGCGFATVDVELLNIVQDLRDHFGKSTTITSGCRCDEHNEKVQLQANKNYIPNSSKSKHKLGIAADIKVKGVPAGDVYNYLTRRYPSTYCFILYSSWVHVDSRAIKYREIK